MKAYHVYLMRTKFPDDGCWEPFETDADRRRFELLTHMYSCVNHKTMNPDIPLVLVTDEKTLRYYDEWKLTGLYDEVITDFHDDYPHDRISEHFWATPKIWAMRKLQAPFIIFDNDIVLHKPLSRFTDCDLLYLHRETTAIYPNPYDIAGPPGFVWDDQIVSCFRASLPMNCAVVGMFNEEFKQDYLQRYFDFALDAPGHLRYATADSSKLFAWSTAQMLTEQWLLAALARKWKKHDGRVFRTRAVAKVLWVSDGFSLFDTDADESAQEELDSNFYHLWGAKKIQNDPTNPYYNLVCNLLVGGRYIVEKSPQYEIVKPVFDRIVADLAAGQ
jgi:hypothetical protein